MRTGLRGALRVCGALALGLVLSACANAPDKPFTDFVVAVGTDNFVLRASDAETIRLAFDNLRRRNARFPIGPLRHGDGGFNAPWSWHLDPDAVRLTEAAIEVCDGAPSYVEAHVDDFARIGYCPWGASIVSVKP
jgi:hypothetical protein